MKTTSAFLVMAITLVLALPVSLGADACACGALVAGAQGAKTAVRSWACISRHRQPDVASCRALRHIVTETQRLQQQLVHAIRSL